MFLVVYGSKHAGIGQSTLVLVKASQYWSKPVLVKARRCWSMHASAGENK
jgi:hypothetical protein